MTTDAAAEMPSVEAPAMFYVDHLDRPLTNCPLPKKVQRRNIKKWRQSMAQRPYRRGDPDQYTGFYRPEITSRYNIARIVETMNSFGVSQPVESLAVNQEVAGSSPAPEAIS